jgi:plastocyanin
MFYYCFLAVMNELTPPSMHLVSLLLIIVLAAGTGITAFGQATGPPVSSKNQQSVVYICPMHPEVRSDQPGTCIKCGVPLVPTKVPPEIIQYEVKLETTPAVIVPGEPVELRFQIFHPKTGEQIKRFNISYDKPFHLFIVSQDLDYYDHSHPTQQKDGGFTIKTTLPKAGLYEVFCEFLPVGGTQQVIHRSLDAANMHGSGHHSNETNLLVDESLSKSVEGVRFDLKLEPAEPITGQPTLLRYYLVDQKTGLPVKDLQPYLGAWGHTATISEDGTEFLHSHPTRLIPTGVDRSKLQSRPGISFHTFFPRPGKYRIWSQFQRENKVITVSFTISVLQLNRIAKWDGSNWSTLVKNPMNSLNGPVRALALNGRDLYVAGDFTTVDGLSANRIAKWNGRSWTALGSGVNGSVWTIAVDGRNVYVGGDFTTAGGISANRIAKWNGSKWSALGNGVSGCKDAFCSPIVYALAVDRGVVYAGGRFATADGIPTGGIAKWNGQSWSALGEGVRTGIYDGIVKALAVNGKDVYAGGQFFTAGGVRTYNIAKWNGESWLSLDGGVRGNMEEVLALGVSGNNLYAGGNFNTAGGISAGNIAKWNGSAWSALDVSNSEAVRSIVVSGSDIYIGGGLFTLPNGEATEGIVKWDGQSWFNLGSQLVSNAYAGPIMTIAINGKEVYIGGDSLITPNEKTLHSSHH